MSKGFRIDNDGLTVWNESRTVFTSAAGRLVNFLNTPQSYSFSAAYPDALKGRIGMWRWFSSYTSLGEAYGYAVIGGSLVGARSQEWNNTIALGPVPAGANLFVGRVRVTRTVSPSHTWLGETLAAPAIAGKWTPLHGSMILERAWGFARALSIYISGGNLIAFLQQSVSGNCGGYRSWGAASPAIAANSAGGGNAWLGGTGTMAQPVYELVGAPYVKSTSGTESGTSGYIFVPYTRHRWDGADPPAYADPTNYSSSYSVEVVGRFGRHAA